MDYSSPQEDEVPFELDPAGGDPDPAASFVSLMGLSPPPPPPRSYLVMPYMFTDLSKVRAHLSEEKVQFLVYQMLCGLRVSGTDRPPPSSPEAT